MVAAVEDQSRTRLGAGGEHHAHQRVSGELQIQSNLSPTKLNFVGLAKNKSTGARRGGGEGVLQVSRIRIERTLTGRLVAHCAHSTRQRNRKPNVS